MGHTVGLLSGLALTAAATVALVRYRRPRQPSLFLLLFGLGLALLAVDKLTRVVDSLHEALHRAGFGDPPLLNGIDDLVYLLGFAVAGAIIVWYRRELVARPRFAMALAGAAVLFAAGFAIDAFGPPGGVVTVLEQWLEFAGSLVLAGSAILPARALVPDEGLILPGVPGPADDTAESRAARRWPRRDARRDAPLDPT